jgi:hypothetical protein
VRECIFCLSKENLNKEDLWPKWVIKSVVGGRSPKIERTIGGDTVIYAGRWVKARCVCEPCNGGWMRGLENESKPILEPMFHDSPCVLDYSKQSTVSQWTIKTAMTFECIKPKAAFYSRADRQHPFIWKVPPPDTLIWIGRYDDSYSPAIEKHTLSNPKRYFLGDGNCTTFAIGHLAIQSITARRSTIGEAISRNVETEEGPFDRKLIKVWPLVTDFVLWPPPESIRGEDTEKLAKRFGPAGGFGASDG